MNYHSDLGTRSAPRCTQAEQRTSSVRSPQSGGVFKSAAVEVLQRERRLMSTGEICRLALEWGLLKCSGKTPEATMASCLYGDLKRRDRVAVFVRPKEGMFGLREWVEQGLIPEPPAVDEGPRVEKPSKTRPAQRNMRGGAAVASKKTRYLKRNAEGEPHTAHQETCLRSDEEEAAMLSGEAWNQSSGLLRAPAAEGVAGNGTSIEIAAMPGKKVEKPSFQEPSYPLKNGAFPIEQQPRIEHPLLPSAQVPYPPTLPSTLAEALVAQAEAAVLEAENTGGHHHPKTGKAYIMLYHRCRDNSLGPHSALRAREALFQ